MLRSLLRALALAVLSAVPAAADVTGTVFYEAPGHYPGGALDYTALEERPVRGARIQLRSGGRVLAETVTGPDGSFTLSSPGGGELEVVLIAESTVPPVVVRDNTDGGAVWSTAFSPVSDSVPVRLVVPLGWNGVGYDPDTRLSGPFAILDAAWSAGQAFLAVRPADFPLLIVHWSPDNRPEDGDPAQGQIGGTSFSYGEVFLVGKEDVNTDEFDRHVVVHEWGHYFELYLSRSDSPAGAHSVGDRLDMRIAFSEGFCSALSAMVLFPDTLYADSYGVGQSESFAFDLELGWDPAPGWFSEGTVQAVLYDLFDPVDDRADRVSLGLGTIFDVMTGPHRDTRALTSIFSFATGLAAVAPEAVGGMDALLAQHAVAPIRDAFGSGATNDGDVPGSLPVFKVAEVNGTPLTLTFLGYQPFNWLGRNRYVGFTAVGGSVTVSAMTDADVSLMAYDSGLWDYSDDGLAGPETVSFSTDAGEVYVLVVTGFEETARYTVEVQVTSP